VRIPAQGKPRLPEAAERVVELYRRKQNVVAVRHVSGNRLVAIVEIVSPGNKSSQRVFLKFVDKEAELLSQEIHLLILDLIPHSESGRSSAPDLRQRARARVPKLL